VIEAHARSGKSGLPKILASERPAELPLSYSQERLWFLCKMGESKQYHIPFFADVHGAINVEALEKSFQYLVKRHESLRTSFADIAGKPIQKIAEDLSFKITFNDLSRLRSADQKAAVEKHIEKCIYDDFDLQQAPLIRVVLLKLGLYEYKLGLCIHHIVSDGWSIKLLAKELTQVYQAFTGNGEIKKINISRRHLC